MCHRRQLKRSAQMLVREAFCLKVESKCAIVGVAMCSMECYCSFLVLTHELKTLRHACKHIYVLPVFGKVHSELCILTKILWNS